MTKRGNPHKRRSKAPAAVAEPRFICVMSEFAARRFVNVTANHRCRGGNHLHLPKDRVVDMVFAGEAEWVGKHHKIAKFVRSRVWRKTMSRDGYASHAVMQLVPGAY